MPDFASSLNLLLVKIFHFRSYVNTWRKKGPTIWTCVIPPLFEAMHIRRTILFPVNLFRSDQIAPILSSKCKCSANLAAGKLSHIQWALI